MKNKYIIIIGIVIVGLIIFLVTRDNVNIELVGNSEVTIYNGVSYIDSGYKLDNDKYTVNVVNNVNSNVNGTYKVVYNVYKGSKLVKTIYRTVNVIENPSNLIKINLVGSDTIYLPNGTNYNELGYEAYYENNNITSLVEIDNPINPNINGNYSIKYKVTYNNYIKNIYRTVIVSDLNFNYELKDNKIYININYNDFDYLLDPNNIKVYNTSYEYPYSSNGIYTFNVYTKSGYIVEKQVNITNYDTNGPVGTCTSNLYSDKTIITFDVTDDSGISKYVYNNKEYTGESITLDKDIRSPKIDIYDNLNNKTTLVCSNKRIYDNNVEATTMSNKYPSCGTNWSTQNTELKNLMSDYGYKTREAVAGAGVYLASMYYNVPYSWGGKYYHEGLNENWGCEKKVSKKVCSKSFSDNTCALGLDCTGYVSWAFIQAGFSKDTISLTGMERNKWGNFSAKSHAYLFSSSEGKANVNQVKIGDVVYIAGQHVGLVVGVSDTYIKVLHEVGGIRVSVLKKSNGSCINGQKSFEGYILMDDYYNMYK